MKALGCREAKWNSAVSVQGRVQPGDGRGDEGGSFASPFAGRQQIGGSKFDGHFGVHEVVQTVRDNMAAEWSDWRVLE
jgi:hypothetical protein